MKLFPPVRRACIDTLIEVFCNHRYAEKIVDHNLKSQKKWGARDRRSYAEIVYEIVRHSRLLLALAPEPVKRDFASLDFLMDGSNAPMGLRVDSDPRYRDALSGLIDFFIYWQENRAEFAEAEAKLERKIRYSMPDELDSWGVREVGHEWDSMIRALNEPARQYLRVNPLKITRDLLINQLLKEEIEAERVDSVSTALRLVTRKNVFISNAFKSGYFEMQDAGSQLIAPMLDAQPGMRVIDACAGAGGKALQLAGMMANKGKIIALDISESKLKELKVRARRAGIDIIETRVVEGTKTIKRLHDSADRLLLDVPCSGLGVIKRHPDTKLKFTVAQLEKAKEIQRQILRDYSLMLKSGGKLVYATCSIAPSENQKQVDEFLKENSGFELEEVLSVSPVDTDFDGFYAARLRKK